MPESRISSCVGCRLRRRKCDQRRPTCTACVELKIPSELCVYRKMSLVSKDSKATLDKLKEKNQELRKIFRDSQLDGKSNPKIPLERYPLFRTVRESPVSLTHFGSTSWAALIDTEPILKAILHQVHAVVRHERDEYDVRRKLESKQSNNDDIPSFSVTKGRTLLSQMGLEREQHLDVIRDMLKSIESNLPSVDMIRVLMQMYKDYNSMKGIGSFLVDFGSLEQAVSAILGIDSNGKTKLNINLPDDLDKMSIFLLFLSCLSFMIFVKNQSVNQATGLNYSLFLEYADALFVLLHNYLSDRGELRLLYTVETFQALFISGSFQQYVPHGKMIDDSEGAKPAIYIRKLSSLGKVLNLNKNVDIYYAHKDPNVRRSLKSLWYSVAAYDCLESLEIGLPPKIAQPFVKYDGFHSKFTEMPIVMNRVLHLYNKIELLDDTYEFIKIIENDVVKSLKDLLRGSFASLEEDIKIFHSFDFNDSRRTQDFFARGQSFALRCLIYSTIQTFYHICYKRLEIIGDTSELFKRVELLTWKYTLLVPFVMKELFIGYRNLIRHDNSETFYPVSSLLMSVFPYMRLAQRRITIFASARFLESFHYDQVSNTSKMFFYQSDNRENEIYETLQKQGLYQKVYNILDYADLDIDHDTPRLFKTFEDLNDTKYIIVTLARTMQSSIQLLANDRYNFNFVTLNYIFFFLLKMSNFFLNQAFPNESSTLRKPSSKPTEFDFSELFEKAIDTTSQKFDFNNFFTNSYASTARSNQNSDMLEDFFAGFDIPSNDSRA